MADKQDEASNRAHQSKTFAFPKRSFGSKGEKRAFKLGWFDKWSWLDYSEVKDHILCFYCSRANKKNQTFVTQGFINWKDACEEFK